MDRDCRTCGQKLLDNDMTHCGPRGEGTVTSWDSPTIIFKSD